MLRHVSHDLGMVWTVITINHRHIIPRIRLPQARRNEHGRREQQQNGKDKAQKESQLLGTKLWP